MACADIDAVAGDGADGSSGCDRDYCAEHINLIDCLRLIDDQRHHVKRFKHHTKGIFLAICGFSAFSVSDASCKWLAQSYSVSTVIAYTSLFSVLCGLALSPLLGGIGRTIKTPKLKFHTGRGIANVFIAFLVVNAFAHLPLATAYTVLFLTPFIVTLLAIPVHGEKVNLKSWLIIGMGFSGILVAFPPGTGV